VEKNNFYDIASTERVTAKAMLSIVFYRHHTKLTRTVLFALYIFHQLLRRQYL
jgi:hypothetical protein